MHRAGFRARALAAAIVAALAAAGPVAPWGGPGSGSARAESEAAPEISADRAAEIARAATGGRVLRVELRRGERPWYRVRVLVDGERVRVVAVDALSGDLRD